MGRIATTFIAFLATLFIAVGSSAQGAERLTNAPSPYLRLHATDVVDWRPWGAEALAEARAANKPILLSIGYLACHWCHVMQKESYSDAAIGAQINAHFIPILIDREERPDLDAQFQHAALILGTQTGWPLTLFLTPAGDPIWGGTYFPKTTMLGMPGFGDVLTIIAEGWAEDPAAVARDARAVTAMIGAATRAQQGAVEPGTLVRVGEKLLATVDPFSGGFGSTAKFPQVAAVRLLWRCYLRTGRQRYLDAVTDTLRAMTDGGLYDHVGGGFFRYTVDPFWRVPHFEKMLNTNSALIRLMTDVWKETRDPVLAARVAETIAWLEREMRLPGGGFASALDADSLNADGHTEEGAYYLWDEAALKTVLGPESEAFLAAVGLTPPEGQDEGAGSPYLKENAAPASPATWAKLRAHRMGRAAPMRDDKIVADWNAMAVRALADAGRTFDRPDWVALAVQTFNRVVAALSSKKDRLQRAAVLKEGGDHRFGGPATVSDLAVMASAAISLFEATGESQFLVWARQWVDAAMNHHWDSVGKGFFMAADDAGPGLIRLKPVDDDPDPSGNGRMLDVLARLYFLTGDATLRTRAADTMLAFGGGLADPYPGIAGFANGADALLGALQIVVVGAPDGLDTQALKQTVFKTASGPKVLQVIGPADELPDGHPAQYKGQVDGLATAYVCRGPVCSLPQTTPDDLKKILLLMRRAQ